VALPSSPVKGGGTIGSRSIYMYQWLLLLLLLLLLL
jgi:hypothetical protein